MPSKSLGTLTLDLVAKIGGFEQGMDKATRKSKSTAASIKSSAEGAGKALGALVGASVASAAALIKSSIDTADAMSKQARIIGVSVEELSGLNYAADLSDVSFEQLTGGLNKFSRSIQSAVEGIGAGSDAFKSLGINVKNSDGSLKSTTQLVGEVADAFQRMPDGALKSAAAQDLFGKSGAKLIPLLNDGSKGLADMTAEAKEFGQVLDTETAAKAEEFNDNLTRLQKVIGGTGNALAAELLPDLVEFTNLIKDPETQSGIKALVKGVAEIGIGAVKALTGVGNLTKFVAESLAAAVNGPALDDLVRVSDRLQKLQDARKDSAFARAVYKPHLAVGLMSDAEIDAEIKTLQKALDDGYSRLTAPALPAPNNGPAKQAIEEIVVYGGKITEAEKKAAESARRAEESRLTGIESVVSGLEREAAMLGKTAEEIEIYDLHSKNAAESDYERVRVAYGLIDAYQSQQDMLESINDQIDKNFEDWLETEKKRMEELLGLTDKTGDDMTKRWEHAVENMQDAFADFLFDPFEEGLDGMLKDFGRIIQRMIAEAAAAQIFDSIIQGGKGVAGSDGGWGSILSSFAGLFDSGGNIPSGSWGIAGEKGPEIVRGPAMVTGRMDTAKALSRGSGVTIGNMNFPGVTNAQEARRAAGAAAREISRVVAGSGRYD